MVHVHLQGSRCEQKCLQTLSLQQSCRFLTCLKDWCFSVFCIPSKGCEEGVCWGESKKGNWTVNAGMFSAMHAV